jgi:hypothetical protein
LFPKKYTHRGIAYFPICTPVSKARATSAPFDCRSSFEARSSTDTADFLNAIQNLLKILQTARGDVREILVGLDVVLILIGRRGVIAQGEHALGCERIVARVLDALTGRDLSFAGYSGGD